MIVAQEGTLGRFFFFWAITLACFLAKVSGWSFIALYRAFLDLSGFLAVTTIILNSIHAQHTFRSCTMQVAFRSLVEAVDQ